MTLWLLGISGASSQSQCDAVCTVDATAAEPGEWATVTATIHHVNTSLSCGTHLIDLVSPPAVHEAEDFLEIERLQPSTDYEVITFALMKRAS